jgi:hypothetical protein
VPRGHREEVLPLLLLGSSGLCAGVVAGGRDADDGDGKDGDAEGDALVEAAISVPGQSESAPSLLAHTTFAQR